MSLLDAAYLRELVFNRQHERWARIARSGGRSPGPLGLRGRGPQIEAIVLLEHPIADDDTMLCEGAPIAAWRLNAFGLCEIVVASFEQLAWPDGGWPFELVRFALDLGVTPAVYLNELTGPDRGNLVHGEARRSPTGLRLHLKAHRRHRPAKPAPASVVTTLTPQKALAFLRGADRALPA